MRFSLKSKIVGFSVFIVLLSSISTLYCLYQLRMVGKANELIYMHPFTITRAILEAETDLLSVHWLADEIFLSKDVTATSALVQKIEIKKDDMYSQLKIVEERILEEQGQDLMKNVMKKFINWNTTQNITFDFIIKGKSENALQLMKDKGAIQLSELEDGFDSIKKYASGRADGLYNKSVETLKTTVMVLIILTISIFVVSLLISLYFAKVITSPILLASQGLNSASAEILASVKQQAASTKEQAVSVQETTSTMSEISQTGAQISDKAKQISKVAEKTNEMSIKGIASVKESSIAMQSIREQVEHVAENAVMLSEKTQTIGDIIETVTNIAEQSNLLALNASIEAVGAGEHGQRFSVVAGEIKKLADQAKESTVQIRTILKEIQKGINTSVMATEEAVKRVEQGKTKSDISAEVIQQLTDITNQSVMAFQQIMGATNQQQIGIEQVTEAFKGVRQATEQTASAVYQIEKTVVDINSHASKLKNLIE